jgi:hypothetical protein
MEQVKDDMNIDETEIDVSDEELEEEQLEEDVFDEEEGCQDPDNKFCKLLLDFKHKLYSQTVLANSSQDIRLLNPYLNLLGKFRAILVPVFQNRSSPQSFQSFLTELPLTCRESATNLYNHTTEAVNNNAIKNRKLVAAYEHFINDMFSVFPFLQNTDFL